MNLKKLEEYRNLIQQLETESHQKRPKCELTCNLSCDNCLQGWYKQTKWYIKLLNQLWSNFFLVINPFPGENLNIRNWFLLFPKKFFDSKLVFMISARTIIYVFKRRRTFSSSELITEHITETMFWSFGVLEFWKYRLRSFMFFFVFHLFRGSRGNCKLLSQIKPNRSSFC